MKKLTKIVAAAAALCLGMCLLAGCSGSNDAAKDSTDTKAPAEATASADKTDADATADNGDVTLVVGLDNAYPPYGFIGEDGNLTGFDIDLAKEVCERNGWNLELEAIDWDAKDALLNQGTINCIWNGFTMEGREGDYTFTDPYMLNEQVVVVKKDSGINNLQDLNGKAVMTQADSAALELLSADGDQADLATTFAGGQVQTISDYNNAFMQLESGMVDAVACDLSIADYQMAANPDMYVKLEPLSSEHYAVGFKQGDTEMANKVTETLKEMYKDGTIEKLCEKWGEYGITIDNWVLVD